MPNDKEVARRRMALCTRRSDEAGDPPCWQALPEDYAARDCEAGCLRDASAAVENGSPMSDDAIERARAEALLRKFGDGMPWTRGQGRDTWAAAIDAMIAFAPQQAPGMVLVPRELTREMLEAAREVPCDDEATGAVVYNTAPEAKAVWSAMLDAAPSVTKVDVG